MKLNVLNHRPLARTDRSHYHTRLISLVLKIPGTFQIAMMKYWIIFVLVAFCYLNPISASVSWGYYKSKTGKGVNNWKKNFPQCAGNRQSPIDISSRKARFDPALENLTFTGYDVIPPHGSRSITNNGHTVKININDDVFIDGGGLKGRYKLLQFHLHWGSHNRNGSEHKIDGKTYPAEVHFIHRSTKFADTSSALKDSQGIAALSFFLKVGKKDNPWFEPIMAALKTVKYRGTTHSLGSFALRDLLPGNTRRFYRYMGSLTTPGCEEAVVWTVFKDKVKISESQLITLRKSMKEKSRFTLLNRPLDDNFRPVQPLGSRVVTESGAPSISGSVTTVSFLFIFLLITKMLC